MQRLSHIRLLGTLFTLACMASLFIDWRSGIIIMIACVLLGLCVTASIPQKSAREINA